MGFLGFLKGSLGRKEKWEEFFLRSFCFSCFWEEVFFLGGA